MRSVLTYMVPINTNSHLKMLPSDGKGPTKITEKNLTIQQSNYEQTLGDRKSEGEGGHLPQQPDVRAHHKTVKQ